MTNPAHHKADAARKQRATTGAFLMTDKPPQPVPRLRHVRPGQAIRLQGVPRVLELLTTDRRYGYFTDMKASLCHEVDRSMMVFGDGGWRIKERA